MDIGFELQEKMFAKKRIENIKKDMLKIFSFYTKEKNINDEKIMNLFKNDIDGFLGCANQCQKLPSIYSLCATIGTMLKKRFNFEMPTINTKPLLSFSSKNTAKSEMYWKIPAHQDYPSNLGSKNGITCWIPLQDIDTNLGPLEFIPNSDKFGELEYIVKEGVPILKNDFEESKFVKIPMKCGDAIFFNTLTIHKSGKNITENSIRWSLHFRYNDAFDVEFAKRKYPKNRTND